jgi:hypothetical protein
VNREQMIAHIVLHGGVPYTHDHDDPRWVGVLFDRTLVHISLEAPHIVNQGRISSNWHDTPGQKLVEWDELGLGVITQVSGRLRDWSLHLNVLG